MNVPASIRAGADLCVKCGLCLPHCPTYEATRDEGDSPRGRIALIQALADGALPPGPRLEAHLAGCLSCRACERACPSQVPYGRLIEAGRSLVGPPPGAARTFRRLLSGGWLVRASPVLRALQQTKVTALVRHLGRPRGAARLERLLPPMPWRTGLGARHDVPAPKGTIGLFVGCMGRAIDRDALRAAIRLINACGHSVVVPSGQGCCGALHRHAGDAAGARALARRNIAAFNAAGVDAIAFVASGCGASLVEYPQWAEADGAPLPALRAEPTEISVLLERLALGRHARFRAREGPALVHEPCSLRNVLRGESAAYRLLQLVPTLRVEPLAGNARCCGGAGTYMIDEPERARALRAPKLGAAREAGAALLLTSNTGCALHLGAGLAPAEDLRIMHPATLLAEQLETGHPAARDGGKTAQT